MLQIVGFTEGNNCSLQVGYLLISVWCEEAASSTPLYWRTGDFKSSLLQNGLQQNTGAICKVTVTFIGNDLKKAVEEPVIAISNEFFAVELDKFQRRTYSILTIVLKLVT